MIQIRFSGCALSRHAPAPQPKIDCYNTAFGGCSSSGPQAYFAAAAVKLFSMLVICSITLAGSVTPKRFARKAGSV